MFSEDFLSAYCPAYFLDLEISKTFRIVIIHYAHGLHERIANCRADKIKAALLQITAEQIGECRFCGNRLSVLAPQGFPIHKMPNVGVKASEFFLHRQKCSRIWDGRTNLQAIANDSVVREQLSNLRFVEFRNALRIEISKRPPVILALAQNRLPIQSGLRTFKNQKLKQTTIVMPRHTPLAIVIANGQISLRPVATMECVCGGGTTKKWLSFSLVAFGGQSPYCWLRI